LAEFQLYVQADDKRGSSLRALRVFHVYRLVVATLLLVLYVADTESRLLETLANPMAFLQVNQIYAILVLLSYAISYIHRIPLRLQTHAAVLVDLIGLTFVVHATGGVVSGLNVLLVPSIAAAGLLLPGRVALGYGAVAFFALFATLLVNDATNDSQAVARCGVLGSILLITAVVSHMLAERARTSERLAREQAVELAELARLNDTIVKRMQTGLVAVDSDLAVKMINRSARQSLQCGKDAVGQSLSAVSPELARHLSAWLQSDDRPGGPAEEPEGLPGLLVAYMHVGGAHDGDLVAFLERRQDAEARLQQVKLAAVGRLTAGIAHEIRNPLAAVSNAAQLLEESEALESGQRRVAEIIHNNARRMNRIVENILQVSRRDQSRPRVLLLGDFLQSLIDEFRSTRPEHFENLDFVVEPPDLRVCFDPSQLHQVVWNLCQNACRHGVAEDGSVRILVRARRNGSELAPVTLDVLDCGRGVSPEQEQQLFEPFFTTNTKGTGLGLYLSKELCQFNRATLTFRPRSAGGSCFRITFSANDSQGMTWPIELH
jgi:two-component system sensor histidine kinase PilS (NtrC family)